MKKQEELNLIKKNYEKCQKCPLAKLGRTQVVFGKGNSNAKLMFIGEGPGRDEDLQGSPFIGRAGQLLTKMIEAMGLKREDVYISNVVKCRPPNNRTPLPDESIICKKEILAKEIALIGPQIICCLGSSATKALLGDEIKITQIRGQFFELNGIKIMPTFHPAYLLRNPNAKRPVWQDLQKIIANLK